MVGWKPARWAGVCWCGGMEARPLGGHLSSGGLEVAFVGNLMYFSRRFLRIYRLFRRRGSGGTKRRRF